MTGILKSKSSKQVSCVACQGFIEPRKRPRVISLAGRIIGILRVSRTDLKSETSIWVNSWIVLFMRERKKRVRKKANEVLFCLYLALIIKTPEKYGLVSVCCSYGSAVQKGCDGKTETGV